MSQFRCTNCAVCEFVCVCGPNCCTAMSCTNSAYVTVCVLTTRKLPNTSGSGYVLLLVYSATPTCWSASREQQRSTVTDNDSSLCSVPPPSHERHYAGVCCRGHIMNSITRSIQTTPNCMHLLPSCHNFHRAPCHWSPFVLSVTLPTLTLTTSANVGLADRHKCIAHPTKTQSKLFLLLLCLFLLLLLLLLSILLTLCHHRRIHHTPTFSSSRPDQHAP